MSCHESNLRLALATGFNIESVVSAVNKGSGQGQALGHEYGLTAFTMINYSKT